MSRETTQPGAQTRWTTRALLAWMTGAFEAKGLESHRVLAELLLAHVLGCERMRLYMDADRPASETERERLRTLVARALRHEPVQYLVGEAVFFTRSFVVDPRVLIPRPSSAVLVEAVIDHARRTGRHATNPYEDGGGETPPTTSAPFAFADVCTGSGCLAISALLSIERARAVATDVSSAALEVARLNAERLGALEQITLVEGDLLEALRGRVPEGGFDALVANPPYISDEEWEAVEPNVKDHEPALALRSAPDGLRHAETIIRGARGVLAPGGVLAVEVATSGAPAALTIARDTGFDDARVVRDFEGLDRAIVATNQSSPSS